MSAQRVVFLHGLAQVLAERIVTVAPPGLQAQLVHRDASVAEQLAAIRDADFLVLYRAPLLPEVMQAARRLRLVQLLASGYDGIPVDMLAGLGIACARNGGANARAVADQAVLMMLALYRRLFQTDQEVRAGRWNAGISGLNTFEMAGKQVGIVGLGDIGKHVARRVQGFEAEVSYFNRTRLPVEMEKQLGVRYAPMDELFSRSDIVSLHISNTPENRRFVDAECLARMKPSALLINTGRGEVVDEPALVQALQTGHLAGAGLDVFEKEPVAPDHPLLSLPNVVLAPHSAGTTADTWVRRGKFAYENIQRVLQGQAPVALVGTVQPRAAV
jgi:phosphoglycerate dehydrogenase-like enzyme